MSRLTPVEVDDFVAAVVATFEARDKVLAAYERVRTAAQEVAGTDLSEWDYETLSKYTGLALGSMRQRYGNDWREQIAKHSI